MIAFPLVKVLLMILGAFLVFQIIVRLLRRYLKFPAPSFIGFFLDSSIRRKFQPPDKLIERSGIKRGMNVLDIGCGNGAFVPSVARAIGPRGKLYALDIQKDMLKQLEEKLAQPQNRNIKNVELVLASAYKLPFKSNFFDLVYMVAALQEIPDKGKALKEMKRVLKPGGILAVTEFLPDPDYPLKSTTIRMGEKAGFVSDKALGNFWNYTVRFIKK